MRYLKWVLGVITAFAIILTAFISSMEFALYSDYGYYEREYEKYEVLNNVPMEMDDLMYVTKEMMRYLKGNRDTLIVETTIAGEQKEFFNDREKLHMEDCRNLFVGAIWLRRIAVALIVLCIVAMVMLKMPYRKIITKSIKIVSAVFALLAVMLAAAITLNFSSAFTKFHEIFFDNDLWLLNPDTDLMINVLPEQFFADTALRIGIMFSVTMLIILIMAFLLDYGILKLTPKDNQNL